MGSGVYVTTAAGNVTKIGTVSDGTGQVRMQDNRLTLFIVDGTPKGGWYCSIPQKPRQGDYGTLTRISYPAFYGSSTISVLDTFFLFTNPGTTNWYVSPANFTDEATTPFDSLYVASKTSYPDTIMGVDVVGQTIWLFGAQETELWYMSGAADLPFQRMPSLTISAVCIAPYSISSNGDAVIWLGCDNMGLPRVYVGRGTEAQAISTFAINDARLISRTASPVHRKYVMPRPPLLKTEANPLIARYPLPTQRSRDSLQKPGSGSPQVA